MHAGRALAPVGVILMATSSGLLVAQGAPGWLPVEFGRAVPADVRVRVLAAGDGCQVFFRNVGTTTVHFGFYVEEAQTQDDVPANGRIHLKPGNLSGALAVQIRRPVQGAIRVLAVQAVVGGPDVASPNASEEPNQ